MVIHPRPLTSQLSVPVNVLDTLVHFRELNLRQQNAALQGEVQRLRSLLAAPRK